MAIESLEIVSNILPFEFEYKPELETLKEFYKRLNYLYPLMRKEFTLRNGLKIKVRRQFIKSKHEKGKVLAYDTETYKGTCKLIARNEGRQISVLNPTFEQCINFLFYLANERNVFRFFYNLDFDISSILKLWNDIEQIKLLKKGIEVFYNHRFSFVWLTGRMFIIKDVIRKKRVVFTDIFNFFKTGLNKASKIYLDNEGKDDIDGNMLNTSLDYWNEREKDIIKYCVKDCKLTAHLGEVLIDSIIENGLELPKYLVSSASLSKQYFRTKCYIPTIAHIPKKILQLAYNCYFGGRFEIFKKGHFNELYLNDINSQYPSFIADLPNLRDGVWQKRLHVPKKPCLAYYKVKVNIPKDYKIPTIPINHKGINKFPVGIMEKWITWFDADLIRDYIIEVNNGYRFYPTSKNYKPFKKEINALYKKKSELKGKSELGYNLTKLTMNALYGCFIETHKNEDIEGNIELTAGVLFNSVYASQITAFGRWSVIKDVPKENYDNVIAIHTDSIISNVPFDKFLNVSKEIGAWNLEKTGSGIVINTGMYQIDDLVKTRGIPKKYIGNWFDFCKKNKIYKRKQFIIPHMRKISECLVRDKSLENVNTIMTAKRSVNPNSDSKRDWLRDFANFNEVLTISIDSLPYCFYDTKSALEPNPFCVAHRYDVLQA